MSRFNEMFDVIIVGASRDGIATYEELASLNSNLNILLLSTSFKKMSNKNISNIKFEQGTVVFSSFNHGLVGLDLDTGEKVFGRSVVIATGTTPKKVKTKQNNGIYYDIDDIKYKHKLEPIVVFGDVSDDFWDIVAKAAKKFKFVYACTKEMAAQEYLDNKKTSKFDNIIYIPQACVAEYKNDDSNMLCSVKLDTYDTITCKYVLAVTERIPCVCQLKKDMVVLTEDGYVATNKDGAIIGANLPFVFGVGSCTSSNSKPKNVAKSINEYLNK